MHEAPPSSTLCLVHCRVLAWQEHSTNGCPYLHDASANKNVHVSNASIAVCVFASKKATKSLLFANHGKHQHRNLIGAVFFRRENLTYDKSSRTHLVRRRNEY